jgi:hypothetical protein
MLFERKDKVEVKRRKEREESEASVDSSLSRSLEQLDEGTFRMFLVLHRGVLVTRKSRKRTKEKRASSRTRGRRYCFFGGGLRGY